MKIDYPGESQIPQLKQLWGRSFPDPDSFIEAFFSTGFSPRRCRCLTSGETVAAALYWFDAEYRNQKFAYLYAVATDPGCRGAGLCRQLMEDTHRLLAVQDYAAALLLPGQLDLRQMYEKFGYRDCCKILEFTCGAGDGIPLAEISWQEFTGLRAGFLPENGAVQKELLFLAAYAKFYRGTDFLLAAVKEGDALYGLELLGRKEAAPGILAALGCKQGSFRCPGEGKLTVMCRPLRESVAAPGYFGLTFD